jgi:hypothetical protein
MGDAMDYGLIGLAVCGIAFFLQLHFRLKKIELKLISLDLRLDSLERDRAAFDAGAEEKRK